MLTLSNAEMRAIGKMLAIMADEYSRKETATPNEIIDLHPLLRPWRQGVYKAGQIVTYEKRPYRVISDHDSTNIPNWTPELAPSLFANFHGTDAKHALPWQAPTGAHDAYNKGEWMIYTDGISYECQQNATTWGPDVVPAAWRSEAKS